MTDKEKIHQILSSLWKNDVSVNNTYYNQALQDVQTTIDLKEEPVSEDLEEAAKKAGQKYFPDENNVWARPNYEAVKAEYAFKDGAKWQKANLWKPADGNDLPEIDREVIALEGIVDPTATDCLCGYEVIFAHRPNPNGWDGKSITTGEVDHYTPKTYGEGGWNIPNVKYWLDCKLPKIEED